MIEVQSILKMLAEWKIKGMRPGRGQSATSDMTPSIDAIQGKSLQMKQ